MIMGVYVFVPVHHFSATASDVAMETKEQCGRRKTEREENQP